MNIKNWTDAHLLSETLVRVKEERRATLVVLEHLAEIERRRLFSQLQYSSLFAYCVEELGYSESAAQRRIESMRLLKEVPDAGQKIAAGKITLSNLARAQSFLRQEKKAGKQYSLQEKKALVEEIAGKSSRAVEKILLEKNPEQIKQKESCRAISSELLMRPKVCIPRHSIFRQIWIQLNRKTLKIALLFLAFSSIASPKFARNLGADVHILLASLVSELRMMVDEKFLANLQKLKGLLAHKIPNASSQEILGFAVELALEKFSKIGNASLLPTSEVKKGEKPSAQSQGTIPAATRRRIFVRAEASCENCNSNHALEIDHIIPRAKGGSNEPINLRILCRHCNQRAAIQELGMGKMEAFLCVANST